MRFRKMLLCTLALSIVGGATVAANEAWKKMRIKVNDVEVAGGINVDGKTYVPLRAVADTLQALIKVDSGSDTVHIYKPNVHLFLFTGDKNAMKPFGNVYQGQYKFVVFAQVDNMMTKAHSIKINVTDPDGQTLKSVVAPLAGDQGDNFWYVSSEIDVDFRSTGQYKVKFFIQQTPESDYELVSEKAIQSLKNN